MRHGRIISRIWPFVNRNHTYTLHPYDALQELILSQINMRKVLLSEN